MKKRSLLVVVALLCMASLMAAMAFTSATVTSAASLKVSNTNDALLALEAGDHAAADYTTGSTSKELVINWAKGNEGEFGVQSGSVYTWEDLFKVTNNSEKTVNVSIHAPIDSATPEPNIGSKVYIKTAEGSAWTAIASRHTGAYNNALTFTLEPGDTAWIDSQIDTVQRTIANGTKGFDLVVDAVAVTE